jgi:hypothetical protein
MKAHHIAKQLACFFWGKVVLQLATMLVMALSAQSSAMADAGPIAPADAIRFVGQVATVCGVVASAKYASGSNGEPTFLNLDKPYPDQVFTAVIWGRDRAKFPYAPESLVSRKICVTGAIRQYRSRAEVVVAALNQLQTET